MAWCLAAGERTAEGRAATTRLTPSLLPVLKMALPIVAMALYSTDFPGRSSEVSSEQVVQIGYSLRLEWCTSDAVHLTEFFALATPNV